VKIQSLSIGGRRGKDATPVVELWPLIRLVALVLGPAGPTRGERADEIGREADNCSCDVGAGDVVDGGAVKERRGGEGGEAGGMVGRRRLFGVPFKSLLEPLCTQVAVGDWEGEFELEGDLDWEVGCVREYGGGEAEKTADKFRG
jgi:hypothetical protein